MSRPKKQHLKRRADGRYCCRYKDKQFMGWTEGEALRAREEYKRQEATAQVYHDRYQTVGDYAAYWLPIHKADVKPSTYNGYASVIDHVTGRIASIRLSSVRTDDIAEVYASLTGKSASYIHKAKILLTAIFDSAVDAGYIQRNPCRASSVKAPRGTRGTHRAITDEERRLILSTEHRMQVPAMIMLYCGLRRGELLALTADDIHRDSLTVSRSVYYVSNQPRISTPKTASGIRTVPVPEILQKHLSGLTGYIASSEGKAPMTLQAFSRGWESYMSALSKAAGHPVIIRPHDLRHSYCTMLRDAGVDMHQAMLWMGHADEKLILRIYDHPGDERQQEAKKRLNLLIDMQNDMQGCDNDNKTPDNTGE